MREGDLRKAGKCLHRSRVGHLKNGEASPIPFNSPTAAMDIENLTLDPLDAVVLDPHPIWLDAVEMVLARIGASVVLSKITQMPWIRGSPPTVRSLTTGCLAAADAMTSI